jgi:hypothetical protein
MGLDASSRLETKPGWKDLSKVKALVDACYGIHKGFEDEPGSELRTQQGFLLSDQFKELLLEAGVMPEITSHHRNSPCLFGAPSHRATSCSSAVL